MKKKYKALSYSIRKRGNDEIEIRHSLLDGYIRGFFRALFIAMFFYGSYLSATYGEKPFESIIRGIQRDYDWAFQPDKRAREQYEQYKEIAAYQYNRAQAQNDNSVEPPSSYDEYKQDIMPKAPLKNLILGMWWFPVIIILFFLPRPRGLRVNRKKRLIYWQSLCGSHSIAYIPPNGDPLSGINYSLFGLYAFGEHKRFSLHMMIKDYQTKGITGGYFGVYPTPMPEHNIDILNAIRAYLTEDDPEFLHYIGNHYKVCGSKFKIMFCNAFAPPIPFNRKKAERALDKAVELWQKQNPQQKADWFKHIQNEQKAINKKHTAEDLDNEV
ncbi:hypothetical protein [Actinobacillus vicugnae]|uniref:hypothetical protein n=1 Tax=Actinobacillus vicugnae TaxID=2573093 RepID=UPI00123FF578|nr:hypothetical protein [Actinobacillus vicugnae]